MSASRGVLQLPLDRLQRWMQAVIVHPGPPEEAVRSGGARALVPDERLADVILPSKTLRPEERLGIYHGMYPLRMRDALADDYPGLEHFLGEEGFEHFILDYVQAHPSRAYTLNRLGDHVPEFISRQRGLKHREFLKDLTRLERTVSEAFDAEETPRLTDAQIQAVPAEAWGKARLVPVASLRLVEVRYPVNEYLESVKEGKHDHPRPVRKDGRVAVYRRNYAVYRQDLSKPAFALLEDLAAGKRLSAALRAAARRGGRAPGEDQLFRWFREWVAAGMFTRVDVA
ncbi:MAG TPA: DNA-binding domain-containing protein [Vicinamibacteria bacterium]